jgi:tetratricopeptide (TPR) repeat protein
LLSSQEISDALARPLTGEPELLRAISHAASDETAAAPLFAALHTAAVRDSRSAELLRAYAEVLQVPGTLSASQCGELALEAAWFLEEQAQDHSRALEYVLRALEFAPDSQRALSLAEALLTEVDDFATLGDIYLRAVEHAADRPIKRRLVKHALTILSEVDEPPPAVMALANLRVELMDAGPSEAPPPPAPAKAPVEPSPAPPAPVSAPEPAARASAPDPSETTHETAARVQTYLTMLEHSADPEERAGVLFALGTLTRDELSDLESAVGYWQRAVEALPTHLGAHEALLAAYSVLGDVRRLDDEISRGLGTFGDPLREKTLLRFVDALLGRGRGAEIWPLCVPLLERATLDDAVLDALERVAMQADDVRAQQHVLERRVASAGGVAARAQALERLGEFFDERLGDKAAASQAWKRAAAEYQHGVNEGPESQRLYERALDAEPDDTEAVTHLVGLYAEAGDWTHVADACAALLRGPHLSSTLELLLALEERAVREGGAHEFAALIDEALASWGDDATPFARRLLSAKARAFSKAERDDEAADVYQALIEAEADPALVAELEALIAASPSAEWRSHRLRWLFAWRVAEAADPLAVELEWAAIEEGTFNDASGAIEVLERALRRDADCRAALESLTRLKLVTGDVEGGLSALGKLRQLGGEQGSFAIEQDVATLLIERLDRPGEALPLLEAALARGPADRGLRALAQRVATGGSAYAFHACELLERASIQADPPEQQRVVLRLLLEQNGVVDRSDQQAAGRRKALRTRWFKTLLDLADDSTAFELSERAAEELVAEPMLWEATEGLAVRLGNPLLAVMAYDRALARDLSADVAEVLGQRLRAFAAEHVEDPRRTEPALLRVLALSPGARWALDHVKFGLSAARRFDELFALYDRAIASATADEQRLPLLDEAAIAARDVASDADRAIGYFRQYLRLKPDDRRVDGALERLYERRGYSDKLIDHLSHRAGLAEPEERRQLHERIATLHVERRDTDAALTALKALIQDEPDGEVSYELLERLLGQAAEPVDADGWGEPVDRTPELAGLLKSHYRAQNRHSDVARVLEIQIARAATADVRVALLEELAELLQQELENPKAAFEVVADLLRLQPTSEAHRERLTQLATQLGTERSLLELLLEVSNRSEDPRLRARLFSHAVSLCMGALSDRPRAAEIYARLLEEAPEPDAKLSAARALDALLAESGRVAERCTVLERLATLETDPARRQSALEQAAELALGVLAAPERAAAAYRAILSADAAERAAHDGLLRALEAAQKHDELCVALVERAERFAGAESERADLERAARLCADQLGDVARAISLWQRVRERFGRSQPSLDALVALLTSAGRFSDLAALLEAEAEQVELRAPLYAQLAEVHRTRTGDLGAAVAAYVKARDFSAAARLLCESAELLSDDATQAIELGRALCESKRPAEAEQLLRKQLAHYGIRHPPPRKRVHLELSALLTATGNSEQALAEIVSASKHDPGDPELMIAVARLASQRGEQERAEQSYRSLLLVLHGNHGDGSLTRAEVYLELSAIAMAKHELEEARDLEASAFEAAQSSELEASGLEATLRRQGRHDLLERALKARLDRAKGIRETSLALAEWTRHHAERQTLGDELRASALKTAEKLARDISKAKKSPDLEAVRRLVSVYEDLAEPERALALLDVLAAKTTSPEERHALEIDIARKFLAIPARRADGIVRLRKLIDGESEPPAPWLAELASALEADGQLAEALATLQRAGAKPQSREVLRAIVRLSDALGEDGTAQGEALERLFELETGAEAIAFGTRLADLRRALGDAAGRERALERVLALDPGATKLRDELCAGYEARSEWDAVTRILARASAAKPNDKALGAKLCAARYQLLAGAQRYDEALAELERASELQPTRAQEFMSALETHALATSSPRWIKRLADTYRARGDQELASPLYRRLLEVSSPDAMIASAESEAQPAARITALLTVARMFRDAGARDAEFSALTKVRALDPAHVGALELMAQALTARGDGAQALALLEAFTEAPEHPRGKALAPIYRQIAEIYLGIDELVEARDALAHAHQLDKAEPELALLLGLVATDLDDLELAGNALRIAVKDRPDAPPLGPSALCDAYYNLARVEHRKGQRTSARRMAARAVQENPRHGDAQQFLRYLSAT